jgi:hypothetical protein
MLQLNKASTNSNISLDVTDGGSNQYPYYLFVFNRNNINYPVICTDQSTTAQRVRSSRFTIIEGANDPTNGSLIIGGDGVYQLNIYGQSSSSNLLAANATENLMFLPVRWNGSLAVSSIFVEHEIDLEFIEHII